MNEKLQTRISGRGSGGVSNEGKKKRSEESSSETSTKKAKQDNSTPSSNKVYYLHLTSTFMCFIFN